VAENSESQLDRPGPDDETWALLRVDLSPDALLTAAASDDPRTRSFANLILGLVDPARQSEFEPVTTANGAPKYRLAGAAAPIAGDN
jgi:hypothetical protein